MINNGKFIMIGNGDNYKSMAYVGNVASFIKSKTIDIKKGYDIFNYVDKPDLTMNDLVKLVENKTKVKIPNIKIPYLIGLLGGYVFDFISKILNKELIISSVRIKKFCATTKFDSSKLHKEFHPPFEIKKALLNTIDYEFNQDNKDDEVFYSE